MKIVLQTIINDIIKEALDRHDKYPTIGYHVTYADRVKSIRSKGLLSTMPNKQKTGFAGATKGVYLITDPSLANWAANDRNLDRDKDWVCFKVTHLDPDFIIADEDFGDTPEESIKKGGTFAYANDIRPEHISVYAVVHGTRNHRHDEFSDLA